MNASDIIKEIEKLPISNRIYIVEKAIQSIRKKEEFKRMEEAADVLLSDYKSNYELTSFTNIDMDSFYETK
ncbi:MAG: hypothetical protein ACERKD_23720 [Prolixibacteraceae bacterium]